MKGQVAFEYMMVVSLVLLFIIPVWSYMNTVHQDTVNELNHNYAKNTAKKLADTADLVYSQGPPASVNVLIYMPAYVEEVFFINETVYLQMNTAGTSKNITASGQAFMNGSLIKVEGNYMVHIEAVGNYVQIDPVV